MFDSLAKQYRNNPKKYWEEVAKKTGAKNVDSIKGDDVIKASSSYANEINKSNKTTETKTPRDFNNSVDVLGALKSQSKISEVNVGELIDPKPYVNALKSFSPIQILKEIGSDIVDQIAIESQLRTDINEKIGIAGELSKGLRNEILDAYPAAIEFGYGIDNITGLVNNMMEGSGRFNLISQETIERTYSTARAFVGSLEEMGTLFNEFERVGLGARSAMDSIDKAGKGSLELGLRAKTTVTDIRNNIERLNEYGFSKGIQGLAEMSRKAQEFRMNMDQVYKIAEKVMSPEGAIDLTANLQVLGGAIGDFNDPLKLMYMATNNVEGLQDALIGAASSLATYNSEQGRFELVGVNLRRAREMAAQLGVDYKEFARGAIAAQERISAGADLASKSFDLKKEDREFITNLSKMDGGKMVIEIPKTLQQEFQGQSQVALADLSKSQIEVLKANKKAFEEMSPADIAKDQFTEIKNINLLLQSWAKGQLREITAAGAKEVEKFNLDKETKELYNFIKQTSVTKNLDREQINQLTEGVRGKLQEAFSIGGVAEFKQEFEKQRQVLQEKLKNTESNTPNNQTTSPTINKVINEITIKADTNGDSLAREIIRNSGNYRGIFIPNKNDYLSTMA
jgi:hypothetical protein